MQRVGRAKGNRLQGEQKAFCFPMNLGDQVHPSKNAGVNVRQNGAVETCGHIQAGAFCRDYGVSVEQALAPAAGECGGDLGHSQVGDDQVPAPAERLVQFVTFGFGNIKFNQSAGVEVELTLLQVSRKP